MAGRHKNKTQTNREPHGMRVMTSAEKAILTAVTAFVCVALVGMVATALSYRDTLLSAQEGHLTTMAASASENLANYFALRERELDIQFSSTQVDLARAAQGGSLPTAMARLLATFGTPDICVKSVGFVSANMDPDIDAQSMRPREVLGTDAYVSRWWREGDGYVLELRKPIVDGGSVCGWVVETLDLNAVYTKVLAAIQVGEHGYCTVKDPQRIIVMHRLPSQIGVDTLIGREDSYPNGDWSELVRVQYSGEAGCRVVTSYWWDDMDMGLVKKLIGYAPVHLLSPDTQNLGNSDDEELFVVNVVMSYDELMSPLQRTVALLFALGILILIATLVAGLNLMRSIQNARSLQRELAFEQQIHAQAMRLRLQDRQMQQTDRLQTAGVIASSFAHEMKNLMTPLSIYGQMMGSDDLSDEERREAAEEVESITAQCCDLLEQMLFYVRHRTSTGTAHRYDATPVVSETTRTIRMLAPCNVRFHPEIAKSACLLQGNPGTMSQILLNLATNALYAMRETGGELAVCWESVPAVEPDGLPRYRLTVTDTGTGMDEETKAKLFKTFFTTKGEEGTGLGMSVIQSLVQELHGSITVDSEPGRGSSFAVTVPQADDLAEDAAAEIPSDDLGATSDPRRT